MQTVQHVAVVTERDGNYMALCSICLWAGGDRSNEDLARQDANVHELTTLTVR